VQCSLCLGVCRGERCALSRRPGVVICLVLELVLCQVEVLELKRWPFCCVQIVATIVGDYHIRPVVLFWLSVCDVRRRVLSQIVWVEMALYRVVCPSQRPLAKPRECYFVALRARDCV